jgi:hypothetical protein
MATSGVVWWGREGAGQDGGGTRQDRDQQQQQLEARSELLFLLLLLAAPLREKRKTEGRRVGWVVDRGQLGNGSQFLAQ